MNENRYYDIEDESADNPVKKLKYFVDGEFKDSIIPEELEHLSISFLAKSRNIHFGG